MGKLKLKYLILFSSYIFFSVNKNNAQNTIQGIVNDSVNKPIPYASVSLKKDSEILSYTFTNKDGFYKLITNKRDSMTLSISSISYKTQNIAINIRNSKNVINVTLVNPLESLDEVIINTRRPIVIKKDTIIFDVKSFTKGNEEVIEDVLRNIPNISVDSEGTIKVGNQEVEKVMIDNDDFFEKGYKLLTKNMPIQPIEKVELIQNYSNNKLLKGIENSNKIALNLTLKKEAKNVWFGNVNLGYDISFNEFYDLRGNLMSFGKKNKYYFLFNANNVGRDAIGDIDYIVKPTIKNEVRNVGNNENLYRITDLSENEQRFNQKRTNFNNAELASFNAIFNLTYKLKLKALTFFNSDENDFFRNSIDNFKNNGINFTNNEEFELRQRKRNIFGRIDIIYDISKTKLLEAVLKYNYQDDFDNTNLIFNSTPTFETLKTKNNFFDQQINYSNKLKENRIVLIKSRLKYEEIPQEYSVNQFFYQDLFPNSSEINNVIQNSNQRMLFGAIEAHFLERKEKGSLFELRFGNSYRKDKLNSKLLLKQDETILNEPIEYQNNVSYIENDLYLKSKYRIQLNNKIALVGKLAIHQLFNSLKIDDVNNNEQNPIFLNPTVGIDYKINDKNKIASSYSYNTKNSNILDIYDNNILRRNRFFTKGTGQFNQLDFSSFILNYQLGNWRDSFFVNTFILYSKNHDFFSTNSTVNQNYTQSEKILIKGRELFSINSKIDTYLKLISSNLKFDLSYSKSNYKNIVNNSDFREIKNKSYLYGIELRSGFDSFFNFHIGTKWNYNVIETSIKNSFTNNESFADIDFVINDKVNFQIQAERYFFGNISSDNNVYTFTDFEFRYKLKENKTSLSLSGKNIFDTKRFRSFNLTDISSSETTYRLLPRFILLKIMYRF